METRVPKAGGMDHRIILLGLITITLVSCASVPQKEPVLTRPLELKVVLADSIDFYHDDSVIVATKNRFGPSNYRLLEVLQKDSVTITLYDLRGKLISTIFAGVLDKGMYEMHLDSSALPPGLYYLKCKCGEKFTYQKVLVLRK